MQIEREKRLIIVGCGSAGSRGKKNRNRNDGCFLVFFSLSFILLHIFSFFLLMHIHAFYSFLSVHLKLLLRILPHSLYFISHPFIVAFPYSSLCCLRLFFFTLILSLILFIVVFPYSLSFRDTRNAHEATIWL